MRKTLLTLLTGTILAAGAPSALAGPKDVINWLKDPCVPTGDMENSCQLPPLR